MQYPGPVEFFASPDETLEAGNLNLEFYRRPPAERRGSPPPRLACRPRSQDSRAAIALVVDGEPRGVVDATCRGPHARPQSQLWANITHFIHA